MGGIDLRIVLADLMVAFDDAWAINRIAHAVEAGDERRTVVELTSWAIAKGWA